jgi:acetyl esterase/lipase
MAQAAEFADALRAAKVPVEIEVLEGCDHFEASLACGDPQKAWAARAASWMRHRGQ